MEVVVGWLALVVGASFIPGIFREGVELGPGEMIRFRNPSLWIISCVSHRSQRGCVMAWHSVVRENFVTIPLPPDSLFFKILSRRWTRGLLSRFKLRHTTDATQMGFFTGCSAAAGCLTPAGATPGGRSPRKRTSSPPSSPRAPPRTGSGSHGPGSRAGRCPPPPAWLRRPARTAATAGAPPPG